MRNPSLRRSFLVLVTFMLLSCAKPAGDPATCAADDTAHIIRIISDAVDHQSRGAEVARFARQECVSESLPERSQQRTSGARRNPPLGGCTPG
jgi:hypothetical protein